MQLAAQERADLADFLETLTDEQWQARTLCTDWRVRDVVAHMLSYEDLDFRGVFGRLVEGRFSPGRVNAIGVAAYAHLTPTDLLARLRQHLEPRGLTAGRGGGVALTDAVIHHQDIRRPLGLLREVPAERLRPVLAFSYTAPPVRGFWHARGVRLVATDLDWSTGRGLEVRGPGEAVLMAMTGRRVAVHELEGPGQPKLAQRLA